MKALTVQLPLGSGWRWREKKKKITAVTCLGLFAFYVVKLLFVGVTDLLWKAPRRITHLLWIRAAVVLPWRPQWQIFVWHGAEQQRHLLFCHNISPFCSHVKHEISSLNYKSNVFERLFLSAMSTSCCRQSQKKTWYQGNMVKNMNSLFIHEWINYSINVCPLTVTVHSISHFITA